MGRTAKAATVEKSKEKVNKGTSSKHVPSGFGRRTFVVREEFDDLIEAEAWHKRMLKRDVLDEIIRYYYQNNRKYSLPKDKSPRSFKG